MLSPAGAITESSKGRSIILLGQLFQDEGNIMTPEKCMRLGQCCTSLAIKSFLSFFFVEATLALESHNEMNMAFCKPTDGHLSRNTRMREAYVFSSENKELLLQ